jgi:hypothetical protein
VQLPIPSHVPVLLSMEPLQTEQPVPDAVPMQAPVASQSVAMQVPVVLHELAQQWVPLPDVPHMLLAHRLLLLHPWPGTSRQAWLLHV